MSYTSHVHHYHVAYIKISSRSQATAEDDMRLEGGPIKKYN